MHYTFKDGQYVVKGYQSVGLLGDKYYTTEWLIATLAQREIPLISNSRQYCSFNYNDNEIAMIKLRVYNLKTNKTLMYVIFADNFDRPYLIIGQKRYYLESFVLE